MSVPHFGVKTESILPFLIFKDLCFWFFILWLFYINSQLHVNSTPKKRCQYDIFLTMCIVYSTWNNNACFDRSRLFHEKKNQRNIIRLQVKRFLKQHMLIVIRICTEQKWDFPSFFLDTWLFKQQKREEFLSQFSKNSVARWRFFPMEHIPSDIRIWIYVKVHSSRFFLFSTFFFGMPHFPETNSKTADTKRI